MGMVKNIQSIINTFKYVPYANINAIDLLYEDAVNYEKKIRGWPYEWAIAAQEELIKIIYDEQIKDYVREVSYQHYKDGITPYHMILVDGTIAHVRQEGGKTIYEWK